MTAPIASGWSESPGGPCTHWKAPPFHGARRLRPLAGPRSNRWGRPLADGRQDRFRPPALPRSATRRGEVGGAGAAHAGRGDRNVRLLQGRGKLQPQGGKLPGLTAPLQAFDEAVQGPDIIGVLRATLYPAAQPQIIAIHRYSVAIAAFGRQFGIRRKSDLKLIEQDEAGRPRRNTKGSSGSEAAMPSVIAHDRRPFDKHR